MRAYDRRRVMKINISIYYELETHSEGTDQTSTEAVEILELVRSHNGEEFFIKKLDADSDPSHSRIFLIISQPICDVSTKRHKNPSITFRVRLVTDAQTVRGENLFGGGNNRIHRM